MRLAALFIWLFLSQQAMSQVTDTTQIIEGKITRQQLENFDWFKRHYTAYKPNVTVVQELAQHTKCSLLVVLGTWCSDTQELIPELFKVLDLAGWEQFELIGVDKKKQCATMDITALNIEYVPVIMLFENKKLKGKIVETTVKSVEEDLLELLMK